ncbi:MAG: DUF4198 domain-containing protein [Pseudomonadota bacterium]
MRFFSYLSGLLIAAWPLAAHEFWISPANYTIEVQDQLVADIRVGENFKGSPSPYLPSRFERFFVVQNGQVFDVTGRVGDRPALNNPAPGDGLVTIVHQTKNSSVTYQEFEKFANFVRHKDFDGALEQHAARGLPETDFREVYSRYGKSLVAVGSGEGADVVVGLLTEIVALRNPYSDDMSGGLPVRVLYQGERRADVQVELFERDPSGNVFITLHRTNAQGEVTLPVKPGHEYLVDAVVLRPIEPRGGNASVWESLWASLTFAVPG